MSVNMSSLWELISEVTDHTGELVDLVVLGVMIMCAFAIGTFVTGILGDTKGRAKDQRSREFWQQRGQYK